MLQVLVYGLGGRTGVDNPQVAAGGVSNHHGAGRVDQRLLDRRTVLGVNKLVDIVAVQPGEEPRGQVLDQCPARRAGCRHDGRQGLFALVIGRARAAAARRELGAKFLGAGLERFGGPDVLGDLGQRHCGSDDLRIAVRAKGFVPLFEETNGDRL